MLKRVPLALAGTLSLLLAAPAAVAQENPKVNVQVFRPSAHVGDLLTTMGSDVGEHTQFGVQLLVNFGKNALVFVDKTGDTDLRHEVIQDQLTADIMASISLWERLSIGLAVPLFIINGGETGFIALNPAPDGFALGDIRLSPKVAILQRDDDGDGFGLAASLDMGLPTGDAEAFVSDGFTIAPTVIADFKISDFLVAANLGYRIRTDEAELYDFATAGSEFFWRIGASYAVVPDQLEVLGELYGASADWSAANNTHLEGMLAGRLKLPDTGLAFTLGGGSGFTKGYGNTKFRIIAGVGWAPEVVLDADADGILDELDKCVMEPEDKDRFQDEDGCPEADNDGDGILDASDRCPLDPEDKDGFQDEDGCPDLDNDGDGLNDPDDKCPDVAEDKDGFQDEDGCVDDDNDNDRIKDLDDKCINEAEVYNGKDDEDGCPDETLAKVEKGKIVIMQKIYFDTGKATIKPESFPVLEAVAGILKANPEIKRVAIEGHTDDVGNDKRNLKLSDDRSKSVMTWLTTTGSVAADRLTAQGFGETRPAVEGKTKEAREANRRVEFIIND